MFFADEFPTSAIVPSQAVTIVTVIWTVIILLGVISGMAFLLLAARRRPALEAEFATKKEMGEGFARVDRDLKLLDARNEELARQIFAELKSMNTSVNRELSDINRSIGKLEGAQDLAKALTAAIQEGTRK